MQSLAGFAKFFLGWFFDRAPAKGVDGGSWKKTMNGITPAGPKPHRKGLDATRTHVKGPSVRICVIGVLTQFSPGTLSPKVIAFQASTTSHKAPATSEKAGRIYETQDHRSYSHFKNSTISEQAIV